MSRRPLPLRLAFAFLLALLLGVAQQAASRHALEHDFERIRTAGKSTSGPDDAVCAKCLAVAHLGHAADAPTALAAALPSAPPRVSVVRFRGAAPAPIDAYLGRAPPTFS